MDKSIYQKGRFVKYPNGYKADRLIFRSALVLMFLFLLVIMFMLKFDFTPRAYFKCGDVMGCKNPFYWQNETRCNYKWCEDPYLPQGVYGEKPPRIISSFGPFNIMLFAIAFLVNHLLYNKGFKFNKNRGDENK